MTSVIEKIRKLRALSQSSNIHEATAAAAAAEKLIQEHQIAEAELDVETEAPDESPVSEELDHFDRVVTWRASLSMILEKSHGCAGYINRRNGRAYLITVGRPSDIATVRYLYAWLSAEIARLWGTSGITGRTASNSFYLGAVAGIKEAMFSARTEARKTATGAALMRIDARLDSAKAALPEKLRSGRAPSMRLDPDAYNRGKRAGAGIHKGAAIGAGGTRLLGSGK